MVKFLKMTERGGGDGGGVSVSSLYNSRTVGLFQLKSEVPVSNYPVLDMYVPHTPVYNSPHQVIRYQVTKSSVLLL